MINFVEVRNPKGKWNKVGPIFPKNKFRPDETTEYSDELFGSRGYDLFTLLGFNSWKSTRVSSITESRGLPDDSEWLNAKEKYFVEWSGETRKEAILDADPGFNFSYIFRADAMSRQEK